MPEAPDFIVEACKQLVTPGSSGCGHVHGLNAEVFRLAKRDEQAHPSKVASSSSRSSSSSSSSSVLTNASRLF